MNGLDYLLIAVILVGVVFAIRSIRKQKGGCNGCCSGCSQNCANRDNLKT